MKQVTYSYSLKEVAAVIATHDDVPDGWWNLGTIVEQLAGYMPAVDGKQDPNPYPGSMARIIGVTLSPIDVPPNNNWYPHAILVKDGRVIMERDNGTDQHSSGSVESSEGPGGYSRPVKENPPGPRRYPYGIVDRETERG